MEVRIQLPFEELVAIVRQLSPAEKIRLQQELTTEVKPTPSELTELLLNGPVFSKEQISAMEENRKSMNQWRTKPS
ncbi:hypothetical protein F5984_12140 [Rudanella paleaurantiibacter]|uniref:Uncharacterized protein n=1 Tax=Rudanella paleaurantiibacter TaxID=2614655 RepID=A0A7J5U060_9BACT|nr:hypothetical protein [Rudanella paleaurantiibacter]KAB7730885.1 hypothetical protein F5984_12140 [Rudanella paleaurantiibacter]